MTNSSANQGMPRAQLVAYAAASMLPVTAVMALGILATFPNFHWYALLHKPSFQPPTVVLGPVWGLLSIMMGWSFFRILCSPDWMPDRPAAIRNYLVLIGLDGLWPLAFFQLHSPRLALGVIAALWLTIVMTIRLFRRIDQVAGLVLVPYLLWVTFASLLNLSIYIRN